MCRFRIAICRMAAAASARILNLAYVAEPHRLSFSKRGLGLVQKIPGQLISRGHYYVHLFCTDSQIQNAVHQPYFPLSFVVSIQVHTTFRVSSYLLPVGCSMLVAVDTFFLGTYRYR
jgi:hypothetical protein